MNYLLLSVSVLLGTGKNILSKYTGKRCSGLNRLFCTNIITALVGMVIFGAQGFDMGIFGDGRAILLAVCYGIFTMLSQMLFILAVEYSPTAVCSLIYSMGFIIPTVFSIIVLGEPFVPLQAVGIALMVISFVCVSGKRSGGTRKLHYAFLAMAESGIIGVIQKLIGKLGESGGREHPRSAYLFLSFGVMLIVSLAALPFFRDKACEKKEGRFVTASAAMGVCISFANLINLTLSGVMPGVIFFTCVNGGTILLSGVVSRLIFKEKLSGKQPIGIGLGIISIILIVV